jgi:non-lysosomal glucosylceramidase
MKFRLSKCAILLFITFCTFALWAGDAIPKIAWKRGIGEPFPNPGTRKPQLTDLIDDGYWQGAPVGGFGSGTFSRTYRGDFSRWHLKAGIHKYETVYSNQFAIYEKSEGASEGIAQVLLADHPKNQDLRSWKWGYWFRSPEAYEIDGNFRASMYMRPAAIWAMEMTEPPSAGGSRTGAPASK